MKTHTYRLRENGVKTVVSTLRHRAENEAKCGHSLKVEQIKCI